MFKQYSRHSLMKDEYDTFWGQVAEGQVLAR